MPTDYVEYPTVDGYYWARFCKGPSRFLLVEKWDDRVWLLMGSYAVHKSNDIHEFEPRWYSVNPPMEDAYAGQT